MDKFSDEELEIWFRAINVTMEPVILRHANGRIGVPFISLKNQFLPAYPEGEEEQEAFELTDFLKELEGSKRRVDSNEGTHKEDYRSVEEGSGEGPRKKCKMEIRDDMISFKDPEIKKAVERLHDCLQDRNLESWSRICLKKDLPEKDLVVAIGVHLVKKLTGGAYTKEDVAKTKCPCGCSENLDVAFMCIGLEDTWHGELDLLSGDKATNLAVESDTNKSVQTTDEAESEETTTVFNSTNLEIERDLSQSGQTLCQIFGESVVFAFTEYNRNPSFGQLIPTILISKEGFTVCIYDCTQDEMYLAYGYIELLPKYKPKYKQNLVGIFLLWICLNHRLFFRKALKSGSCTQTGFLQSLDLNSLEKYKSLREFRKHVEVERYQGVVLQKFLRKLLKRKVMQSAYT